ncbi:thioredoxin reductase 3 isoform X4 [Cervus canadensis]|uniref:thioredoxin reductase 3 isoform X4 n=1 Tax=Cervus canadensis TaxID=1574408 RepID=UPI001CA37D0E|nr:thioredoxin reductase 3 isoform X4 [Cervus canadensis]
MDVFKGESGTSEWFIAAAPPAGSSVRLRPHRHRWGLWGPLVRSGSRRPGEEGHAAGLCGPIPPRHVLGSWGHVCECWLYPEEADAPGRAARAGADRLQEVRLGVQSASNGLACEVCDFTVAEHPSRPPAPGLSPVKHSWATMTEAIQSHIGSLSWGHRLALREKAVTYVNSYGEFVEHHKVKATNEKGQEAFYTAAKFVIATGERPRYLGIQGDKEYCITSDDLFSLPYCPGATLVVGASYVALECAGFLAGLGLEVTVMVRSVLLRGFDREMAEKVGASMQQLGVRFLRKFMPVEVQQLEKGLPGRLKVVAKSTEGTETMEGVYNTVLLAVGRDSCTKKLGLEKIGVNISEKTGKIPVNDEEQTSVPYIYAVGDVLEGKPQLTPVAVQAGKLLARRLFGGRSEKCDYVSVPTVVFTPLEYGCCGYSEEKASEVYQAENLNVYHTLFWPLEWTVACRDSNTCYAKIICNKLENDRVVGFHVLGPNAGEITQGFAAAMKCGLTKQLLDDTIGIHPTCGEVFTTLEITKASGLDITQKGC